MDPGVIEIGETKFFKPVTFLVAERPCGSSLLRGSAKEKLVALLTIPRLCSGMRSISALHLGGDVAMERPLIKVESVLPRAG
jgi:hypothetical protein